MTRRPTGRRRAATVVLAVTVAAVALLSLAGSAEARAAGAALPAADGVGRSAIVDCIPGLDGTSAPQSMAPSEVAGAFFDPSSARPPAAAAGVTPPGSVPPNTLTSYGWAGFSWPDYDPGCTTSISLDDRLTGTLARASMSMLAWANAATTGASRYAYDPATYDPVDQIAKSVDSGIGDGFARPGFWIVALLLGAALVWTADRRSPRHHAQAATVVLALGLSVVTVSTWNATLGPAADRTVLTVVSWANGAATPGGAGGTNAGQQIGESLRSNIVLRTWRSGVFGPNDATANQYADALFAAGAISNAEAAAAGRDSAALGKLAEADKATYDQLAGQIKRDDERAYGYLAGTHNGARLFYVTLGWLTWLWAASFQTVAAFATAYSLTLVRLVLGLWSAIALVALFRPRYALRAVGLLVGALVAGIGLSVVAAGARLAYGQLLATAATANTWVTVGVGLVVCAATWVIAWPLFRVLPGTPERLRRMGGRPVRPDGGAADVDAEPGSVANPTRGLSGPPGESPDHGVPAEATGGRAAAGVLVAAAEGLQGRGRRGAPAPVGPPGPLGVAGAGVAASVAPAAASSPSSASGPTGAAGANGLAGRTGAVAATAAPGSAAPTAGQVGAQARPSGHLSSYGEGGMPGAGPADRDHGSAPVRAPRKAAPSVYPIYLPPRSEPERTDTIPGRPAPGTAAPGGALPAGPEKDRGGPR